MGEYVPLEGLKLADKKKSKEKVRRAKELKGYESKLPCTYTKLKM